MSRIEFLQIIKKSHHSRNCRTKKNLNLSYLCTYGCLAKVNAPTNKKCKLRPKSVEVYSFIMLFTALYVIINSGVSDMHVGSITLSRDATFSKSKFPINATSTSSHEPI